MKLLWRLSQIGSVISIFAMALGCHLVAPMSIAITIHWLLASAIACAGGIQLLAAVLVVASSQLLLKQEELKRSCTQSFWTVKRSHCKSLEEAQEHAAGSCTSSVFDVVVALLEFVFLPVLLRQENNPSFSIIGSLLLVQNMWIVSSPLLAQKATALILRERKRCKDLCQTPNCSLGENR